MTQETKDRLVTMYLSKEEEMINLANAIYITQNSSYQEYVELVYRMNPSATKEYLDGDIQSEEQFYEEWEISTRCKNPNNPKWQKLEQH